MIHIHPFPARMAPDIALSKIDALSKGDVILDPMSGSGMVLSQAARNGFQSIGYDLDPMARLLSRVGATRVNEKKADEALSKLIENCSRAEKNQKQVHLDWIDSDQECMYFVNYWFYRKQIKQLRLLSYYLNASPVTTDKKIADVLKVALSRLIVTKEPKASLARDTAHSRPHKTIEKNSFDIFAELPASLRHVLKALDGESIQRDTKTYLGDARRMTRIADSSIDAIITSPPYLNAIDYMRGHRLSLVWMGHSLSELRNIRGTAIGAERSLSHDVDLGFPRILEELRLKKLDTRNAKMLYRYYCDLTLQMQESHRVLKRGASATYVIGNSMIRGNYIRNSELLKKAATLSGFKIKDEAIRKIPTNKRYMPLGDKGESSLASRMREEHVIEFIA